MTKTQGHCLISAMAVVAFFIPDPHYSVCFNLVWIWSDMMFRKGE